MNSLKNIFFVCAALLIMLPSAISFSHIFSGHSHKLCDNYSEKHYHSKSVDCDLYHFHKNPALEIEIPNFSFILFEYREKITYDYYQFLNEFEALPFDLRGPPSIA